MSLNTLADIPVKIADEEQSLSQDVDIESVDAIEPLENNDVYTDTDLSKQAPLIELPLFARLFFVFLLFVFIAIGATYFWAVSNAEVPNWLAPVMTTMWVVSGIGSFLLLNWMWRQFNQFSNDLSLTVNQLLKGDFASRMPIRTDRCPSKGIRSHINAIAEDYESLSHYQQQRLERQARYIKQKKYYLSVLYDVAACINQSHNLDELLQRFLETLTTVVNAKAATVRLLDKDDQMRLVASIGLSDEVVKKEEFLPAPTCLCGKALTDAKVMVNTDIKQCGMRIGDTFFEDEEDIEMLAIPLQYR